MLKINGERDGYLSQFSFNFKAVLYFTNKFLLERTLSRFYNRLLKMRVLGAQYELGNNMARYPRPRHSVDYFF